MYCFNVFPCSSIAYTCFSNALTSWEHENLASSFSLCCCVGNISSPVRYSCLSILPEDNADIFTATLSMSYCNFSALILTSIIVTIYCTSSNRFFEKCNGSSDRGVVSMTINEYFLQYIFCIAPWSLWNQYQTNNYQ